MLHAFVVWDTARITQWKVLEKKPGHSALLDNIPSGPNDNGWDVVRFEVSGRQTGGLVANGSERDEDRHIDLVFPAQMQNLRRIDVVRAALAVRCWNAVETVRQAADASFGSERLHGSQREKRLDIPRVGCSLIPRQVEGVHRRWYRFDRLGIGSLGRGRVGVRCHRFCRTR